MFFERIPHRHSGSLFATRTLSDLRDARYFSADDGTHCYVRGAGFTPLPARYWPLLGLTLLSYAALTHGVKTMLLRRRWIS